MDAAIRFGVACLVGMAVMYNVGTGYVGWRIHRMGLDLDRLERKVDLEIKQRREKEAGEAKVLMASSKRMQELQQRLQKPEAY